MWIKKIDFELLKQRVELLNNFHLKSDKDNYVKHRDLECKIEELERQIKRLQVMQKYNIKVGIKTNGCIVTEVTNDYYGNNYVELVDIKTGEKEVVELDKFLEFKNKNK